MGELKSLFPFLLSLSFLSSFLMFSSLVVGSLLVDLLSPHTLKRCQSTVTMPTPSLHVFALAFLPSLITAAATNLTANYNPSGTGCVDPSGFLSCYSAQGTKAVSCVNFCDSTIPDQSGITYQNCVLGCEGAWLAGNIGCWIQGCWNQVC